VGVEDEVHEQVHPVLAGVSLEYPRLVVGLGQQHGVAALCDGVAFERPQQLVWVVEFVGLGVFRLDHERGRVDPESVDPELQPELHDLVDFLPDVGVGGVQVRLERVEPVVVVRSGLRIVRPDAVVLDLAGEHRPLVGARRRRFLDPDVVVPVLRVRVVPCLLEPGVLVRRMVHHEVDEHSDPALVGFLDELDKVPERSQPRVDPVVIRDVVAVVAVGRRIKGEQPEGRDAQPVEVIEPLYQPLEVANSIAVRVVERFHVESVYDRVLVPGFRLHE